MYAIIEDSGTQIRVRPGDVVDLDLRDLEEGAESISFDRVLMTSAPEGQEQASIGQPYLEGVKVNATILGEVRGPKLDVFKFKRRKGQRRKIGHRQRYLRVRITGIEI